MGELGVCLQSFLGFLVSGRKLVCWWPRTVPRYRGVSAVAVAVAVAVAARGGCWALGLESGSNVGTECDGVPWPRLCQRRRD
ncbi:uncharacterized protein GGS25DRAFT_496919 [Hypoxylon fragiforme]|uniref:uncharacterized protein n=1 Tax=Hypoxylon fragiforme TaxID=63214 RepID=UPI0020C7054E|nr:uncharacterized protein GGS25DRAFT_496919 [Hypoxylon fragiforme]KAI2607644.1 hypothetical protein GGS25DRAFT_496919 [Hypoxylon fragiforme]